MRNKIAKYMELAQPLPLVHYSHQLPLKEEPQSLTYHDTK